MTYESQLQKLRLHYRKYGNLPTYDRMREIFGCKSKSTAYYAVNRLIAAGFLRRRKQQLIPGPKFDEMSFFNSVKAGFPGPAEEEANDRMNLDDYLVDQPNSTFFMRVKGDHMQHAGILNGDIAIVRRSLDAHANQVVVLSCEGEVTIKNLALSDYVGNELLGVVTGIARKL
jgi:repressor LexA